MSETAIQDRTQAQFEAAAQFLSSQYIEAVIGHSVALAVQRSQSPWLDREAAAARYRCSVSEIDRAAKAGVFPTYHRGGTPLFTKTEMDEAILENRWKRS